MTFIDLKLIEPIFRAITKEGYEDPTPIQKEAIPHILSGKDVVGIAQTGTGKTGAFTLPLLQKLELDEDPRQKKRPKALILAPTRELAVQIGKSCSTYGRYTKLKHTVIYGGVKQFAQVKTLNRGVDILIATPGRLMDLMEQQHVFLDEIHTFILDEADRMLDMGFVHDIRHILESVPEHRQTIMFSATMPKGVAQLAKEFLKKPVQINISQDNMTVDRIKQELFYVERKQKLNLLLHLMAKGMDHVIIFTRTKAGADRVAKALVRKRIYAESIHGDKTQRQRTRTLESFKKGNIVLVATDVAARGLDVDGITHVINYDLPNDPENYVHRIGRTARAGTKGIAYSFCDETEKSSLIAIEDLTKQKIDFVKHPFHSAEAQKSKPKPQRRGRGGSRSSGRGGFGRSRNSRGRSSSERSSSGRSGRPGRSNFVSRRSEDDSGRQGRSFGRDRRSSSGGRSRDSSSSERPHFRSERRSSEDSGRNREGRGRRSRDSDRSERSPSKGRSSFGGRGQRSDRPQGERRFSSGRGASQGERRFSRGDRSSSGRSRDSSSSSERPKRSGKPAFAKERGKRKPSTDKNFKGSKGKMRKRRQNKK